MILLVSFFQGNQRTVPDSACRKRRRLFSWSQLMLPAFPTLAHTFSFTHMNISTKYSKITGVYSVALCLQH